MSTYFLEEILAKLALLSGEFEEPDTLSLAKYPTTAIIHELDIVPNGKGYDLKFVHHRYRVTITGISDLESICKALSEGKFDWMGNGEPAMKVPFSNYLSVGNNDLSYIIYALQPERNWQFRHLRSPITLSKLAKAKGAYCNVVKAGADGKEVDLRVKQDGCRVAYFVADAAKAFGDDREYVDRINLHVDMVSKYGSEYLFMPIIIDPDIRYPGGSSP